MFHQFSIQTSKIKKPKSTQVMNKNTIITIASIIQREAADKGDMKLISGIIWNRIFSGMKLQVDATLQYAKGSEKNGWWEEVKPKDKKIDSPYNTYTNLGLPPTAITNPGIDALLSAVTPLSSPYYFYLSDKEGEMHYAKTFAEHIANKGKYLR